MKSSDEMACKLRAFSQYKKPIIILITHKGVRIGGTIN